MFTVEERDRVREQLLARAEADGTIAGAAFTGSHAVGESDRWSDTDLVLAVRGELTTTLNRWTRWLYDDLGAQHHWDLPAERVHAVPHGVDVDAFKPDLAGGPAIYDDSPLQQRFRDAHTATAHFQVNEASLQLPGRIVLGQPAETAML